LDHRAVSLLQHGFLVCSGASSSPRVNAVSSAPLLRAITEHQSMEEREAADYHLPTTVSGSGEEDYERLSADDGAFNSQLGWTYVDYMKAAGLDPGERECFAVVISTYHIISKIYSAPITLQKTMKERNIVRRYKVKFS